MANFFVYSNFAGAILSLKQGHSSKLLFIQDRGVLECIFKVNIPLIHVHPFF